MIDWLLDLMDLPDNLERGLMIVRPVRGLNAGIMAAVLLGLCWLMWPWLYYFDIESTAVWSTAALDSLGGTLAGAGMPMSDSYNANIGWFVTGSTFLPTLIELFTVKFATGGIKAARVLVLFFATFDLVTDYPRVSEFVDVFNLGFWGLALKVPLLLLASFGFQSLFIVFGVCGVLLCFNVRQGSGAGARPAGMRV
ncbi:MAG: hypothetical protein WCG26_00990 [Chloroflexales bacterium]